VVLAVFCSKLFEKKIQREEFEQKGAKTTKKSCFAKATKDRDVAAFSFWEYPKPKIPQRFSRRREDHTGMRNATGFDFVFDCSSQTPLRDFNAGAWTIPRSAWSSIKRPCIQMPQHSLSFVRLSLAVFADFCSKLFSHLW
jgi:hypothetical protein